MTKLKFIFFDGKSYANDLVKNNSIEYTDIINRCAQLNFTPVDSIEFIHKINNEEALCNITILFDSFDQKEEFSLNDVPLKYFYTDIKDNKRKILYPSHNPSPDPGGLY